MKTQWVLWSVCLLAGCAQSSFVGQPARPLATSAGQTKSPLAQYSFPDADTLSAIPDRASGGDGESDVTTKEVNGKAHGAPRRIQEPTIAVQPDLRIIYTAALTVAVENFDAVPDDVSRIVQSYGGYIAETRVGNLQGTRRSGFWRIRVPNNRYRDFLQAANGLGVPESLTENAKDVSEEYADLEARITSKKKLEENVSKLLERRTEKIEDLVAIERELARIREEIERMEGRKQFLDNQVAMSTVNLTITEERVFVPAAAPTMGGQIALEFSEANRRAARSFESFVVRSVANTYQILWFLFALLVVWSAYRTVRRKRRSQQVATAQTSG